MSVTRFLLLAGTALFTSLAVGVMADETRAGQTEGAVEVRHGEYVWTHDGDRMPITLTFTPLDDGRWKTCFDFTIGPKSHTYEGTLEGSLENGRMHGLVIANGGRRKYRIEGHVKNSAFEGTHTDISQNDLRPTGTLVFSKDFDAH